VIPSGVDIPPIVHELAGGDSIEVVWRNEIGGLTFKLGRDRYLKWLPAGSGVDLGREADRLAWAARWITVPSVLDRGQDWLLTKAIDGRMAVLDEWKVRPLDAVRGLGQGLRRLHDALPTQDCPFSWTVETRLARVENPPPAVMDPPPIDQLVVCHGDACAPNTLLHTDGTPAGYVDLGSLGLADRWADIAVATWSLEWNFGPGHDRLFLDSYGVNPDPVRTAYYRQLWNTTD